MRVCKKVETISEIVAYGTLRVVPTDISMLKVCIYVYKRGRDIIDVGKCMDALSSNRGRHGYILHPLPKTCTLKHEWLNVLTSLHNVYMPFVPKTKQFPTNNASHTYILNPEGD